MIVWIQSSVSGMEAESGKVKAMTQSEGLKY